MYQLLARNFLMKFVLLVRTFSFVFVLVLLHFSVLILSRISSSFHIFFFLLLLLLSFFLSSSSSFQRNKLCFSFGLPTTLSLLCFVFSCLCFVLILAPLSWLVFCCVSVARICKLPAYPCSSIIAVYCLVYISSHSNPSRVLYFNLLVI
jgi:hypothetical protein